jgi:hypothetical protein
MNRSYDDSYNWLKSRDYVKKQRREVIVLTVMTCIMLIVLLIQS